MKVETTPDVVSYGRGTWWQTPHENVVGGVLVLVFKQGEAILVGLDGTWFTSCEDNEKDIQHMIMCRSLRPFTGEIRITV